MSRIYARLIRKHWHEYSPPSGVNWFSAKTLNHLFSNYRFRSILIGCPSKKITKENKVSLLRQSIPNLKKKILNFLDQKFPIFTIAYLHLVIKWFTSKNYIIIIPYLCWIIN